MADSFDWAPNPLWDFSIALYRRPRVAEACLALQEKLGIDVNLMLYFIWAGRARGCTIGEAEAATAMARAGDWHDAVVRPLRALRTRMKGDHMHAPAALAERLRSQIKSAEINAERIE